MDNTQTTYQEEQTVYDFSELREATPEQVPNAVLARLIAEVRNEEAEVISSYNRFHNRHNR